MDKKSIKISLVINLIIVLFTIIASIIMFTGIKIMEGEPILETTKLGMFKFFTVDSNLLMGIVSLIFVIKEKALLEGKIDEIPVSLYIMKLVSTVGVALTFLVVFCYLGPIASGGLISLLKNGNLFFHLLIPLLSIINFIFFERTDKLKFKYSFIGILTALVYAIFYLINVLIHIENGKVSPMYDWYWFVQGGLWQAIIVLPLMLVITYIISLLLWKFNRKR